MTNKEFIIHVLRNVSGEFEGDDIIEHAKKLVAVAESVKKAESEGYALPYPITEALENLDRE